MKIEEIILEHKNWKMRVSDYIHSPDKSLSPEKCHERCCQLSNWLMTEDAFVNFSKRELEELLKSHKAFHHTIAEIVLNVDRGVKISEELALGIDSTFNRHSENLIRLLNKIKAVKEAA